MSTNQKPESEMEERALARELREKEDELNRLKAMIRDKKVD